MKILKKLVLGKVLNESEMGQLRGGSGSNLNDAQGCYCEGSTDSVSACNNNSNKMNQCSCYGNDNNSNNGTGCSCGEAPYTPEPAPYTPEYC
mgnify:CR=1 FL=1